MIVLLGCLGGAMLIVPIVPGASGPAAAVAGALIAALGIAYLVLPFGDVSTIRWLGLERTIVIGRSTGVVLVLVGLGLLHLAFRSF